MKYTTNLTANQARYLIDHGKLLIVERIEPQPISAPLNQFEWNGMILSADELTQKCPFATIGEVTKFREPFLGRTTSDPSYFYAADRMGENRIWEHPDNMFDNHIRLSGKCVKVEALKESHKTMNSTFNDNTAIWAWFVTFEKP